MVVFEPRTDAVSEYFVCQHIGVSLIFKLFISTNEKMLNNIPKCGSVRTAKPNISRKTAHFQFPSVAQKTCVLNVSSPL